MENDRESKLSETAGINTEGNNLEGDKAPFNVSPKRIGALMERDFHAANKRLLDRGFNGKFIWHFIQHGEVPSRRTIKNHLGNFGIDPTSKTPEIMYLHVRWIFFYLIQLMRGMISIHREDTEFARKLGGQFTQIPKNFKDNRENYFLQGYLVGMSSKYINDPDAWVSSIKDKQSRMASKAGKGKKGVITSPASKAILLAFDYGHLKGKKVRQFFDDNPILDEIGVDIEFIDKGKERVYRFCGLDESKDTELTKAEVNVRVSQLKKDYEKGN